MRPWRAVSTTKSGPTQPGEMGRVRLVLRRRVRWVVAALALAGFATGVTLDYSRWLNDLPLTANVLAGMLGAPVTVLLALVIFDRLSAAQREQDWVERRSPSLRDAVLPSVRNVVAALQRCWPIDASAEFAADLAAVIDEYGALSRSPAGVTEPVGERLRSLTKRVSQLTTGSTDLDATVVAANGMIPALDLAIHQADAPGLTDAAFTARTAARSYIDAVATSEWSAGAFTSALRDIATKEWEWTDQGKYFTWFDGHGGYHNRSTVGISTDGFTYRQLLAQADALVTSCTALARTIRETIGDNHRR